MTRLVFVALGLVLAAGCNRSEAGRPTGKPLVRSEVTLPAPAQESPAPTSERVAPTAPSPSASAAATTPVQAEKAELAIRRLVVARGVEGREPTDPTDRVTLSEGERLYAFVELHNRNGVPGAVSVEFEAESGRTTGAVRLSVGASPRYRTWAYSTQIDEPGVWHAVVRDEAGRVLGRHEFDVVFLHDGSPVPEGC